MADIGSGAPESATRRVLASYARVVLVLIVLVVAFAGLMAYRGIRHEARRTRARVEMEECRKAIGIYSSIVRPLPARLEDLRRPMTQADADAIEFGPDPWGNEYSIEIQGRVVTITCLGADGAPGGSGADEDIVEHWPPPDDPLPR